jgi:pseudaminic acid synthase
VASSDVSHVKLLEELNKMNKPVILSIGATNHSDIESALSLLASVPVVLMYCVSAYPAREVDLELIKDIGERYGHLVGFSDHTIDVRVIPTQAIKWGAVVLEKHFKLRDFPGSGDSPFALTREEFKLMIDAIRGKRMLQCYTREESEMILKHNRRLIVTRNVAVGETFQDGVNFGAYRSKKSDDKGLSGFLLNRVEGRQAAVALLAGDSIGPFDILTV